MEKNLEKYILKIAYMFQIVNNKMVSGEKINPGYLTDWNKPPVHSIQPTLS